jgi:hypothetical protein
MFKIDPKGLTLGPQVQELKNDGDHLHGIILELIFGLAHDKGMLIKGGLTSWADRAV